MSIYSGTGYGTQTFIKKIGDQDGVIHGLPPTAHYEPTGGEEAGLETNTALAVFPILTLKPMVPKVIGNNGLNIFEFKPDDGAGFVSGEGNSGPSLDEPKFSKIVKSSGLEGVNTKTPVRLAIQNDTQISETFTNDYGDGTIENTVMGLRTAGLGGELTRYTGKQTTSEALSEISNTIKGDSLVGRLAGGAVGLVGTLAGGMEGLLNGVFGKEFGNAGTKILSGAMVDFPAIWQSTGYTQSYSVTVRLCNPNPTNPELYRYFILEPLVRMLAFVTPWSDDGVTFTYPLLVDADCPGLFRVPAGYISSIDVIKGGEYNNITWHQQPAMIDVKLNISSVYSTLVASATEQSQSRPTLKKYIDNLSTWANYAQIGLDTGCGPVPPPAPPKTVKRSPIKNPDMNKMKRPESRIPNNLKMLSNSLG